VYLGACIWRKTMNIHTSEEKETDLTKYRSAPEPAPGSPSAKRISSGMEDCHVRRRKRLVEEATGLAKAMMRGELGRRR